MVGVCLTLCTGPAVTEVETVSPVVAHKNVRTLGGTTTDKVF